MNTELAFTVGVWAGVVLTTGYVLVIRWLDKRKGRAYFPLPPLPPVNYNQRCIDALVWRGTNPWMIYGARCDPFRNEICAAAQRTNQGLWQCQGDGTVPDQYRDFSSIEDVA